MSLARSAFTSLILVVALAAPSRGEENLRTVSTTGEATVFVTPNEAQFNFGVETVDPSLEKAQAQNEEASARLVKAVTGLGIDMKDIGVDRLQLGAVYDNRREGSPIKIIGYRAIRGYSVKVKDLTKLQPLFNAVVKNGANQIHGMELRTTELRKYRDQARKMAIAAAREKATNLVGALNCKLGVPRTISEQTQSFSPWSNTAQRVASAPGESESGESLPLGQISVKATVNVVFDFYAE